jgi:diadenosine tetraphosphate (Ap4A) HIT family hydrolase
MDSEKDPDELIPAELSGELPQLTAEDFREITEEVQRVAEAMRKRIERMEALTADDYRVRVR